MKVFWILTSLVVFIAMLWLGTAIMTKPAHAPVDNSPVPLVEIDRRLSFQTEKYGIAFTYSPELFVFEKDVGTPESQQHAIILAEDTQENRDLFAGKISDAREGPPTITIDIYPNRENTSTQEWIENSTAWTLSDQRTESITVNGHSGLSFSWSGLYEGKSTVVTTSKNVYVLSVTWLDESSPTLADYEKLLEFIKLDK